jgi:hypothetical protein
MVPRPTTDPPTAAPTSPPATLEAEAQTTSTPTTAPLEQALPGGSAPGDTTAPAEAPFAYLWPAYLPEGMAPAARESRVAREGELGPGDIGFFVVTFNGEGRKLVVGGGAAEPLPLTGRITTVRLGERGARMVASGEQRQLAISGYQGALFVYGSGVSEEELLRVAESLAPIDVGEMRRRVGGEP